MTMVSYAQNGEDIMLSRALRGVAHGSYIDAGAAGPVEHSVTKTFYDRGWTGINIEPTQRYFDELTAARPHDVNIQAALDERAGEATFFAFEGTGLSTLDGAIAEDHKPGGWPMTRIVTPTRTLADVCAEFAAPTIHFLKIDVEGAEDRVLRGADFARFRPWIVVVEATRPMSPEPDYAGWEPILTAAGYEFVWFDALNRFYLAAEKANELRGHFTVPVNYFDDYELYNPGYERLAAEAVQLRARVGGAEATAAELRARVEGAEAEAAAARVAGAAAAVQAEAAGAASRAAEALAQAADASSAAAWDRLRELQGHIAELRREADEGRAREGAGHAQREAQRADYEARLSAMHGDLHGRRLAQDHAEAQVAELAAHVRRSEEEAAVRQREAAKQAAAVPVPAPAAMAPRRPSRTLLHGIYRALLRPVVRPAMWRTRSFLVAAVAHEQARLRDDQRHAFGQLTARADRADDAVRRLENAIAPLHHLLTRPGPALPPPVDMSELVEAMETAMMTLAVTARAGRVAAE